MRLIDADALMIRLMDKNLDHVQNNDGEELCQIIDNQPTVCDIEQIWDEIETLKVHGIDDVSITNNFAIDKVLQIINKHMKRAEQ